MAYFEFPHTRNYDGDLGWIIKTLTKVSEDTKYLMEEWSKIVILTEDYIQTMINESIATNNTQLYNDMQRMRNEITTEYQAFCRQQIDLLQIYVDNQDLYYFNLAKGYTDDAEQAAKDYTDAQVLTYTMMINPITGEYQDVRLVVDDIVSYFHTQDTLTAIEYDTLELTASAYDAYDITAYDYDFSGKTILMP